MVGVHTKVPFDPRRYPTLTVFQGPTGHFVGLVSPGSRGTVPREDRGPRVDMFSGEAAHLPPSVAESRRRCSMTETRSEVGP